MTATDSARSSKHTPTAASARPDGMLPQRQINLIFVGLLISMLLASLDQMIFSTALPTIVGELDGVNHMLWVTTAYIVAVTVMMPIYGKLGDLIGRKVLMVAAILLFMAGSIIGGLAPDMTWLITGRAVQGLGGGGLMILAQAVIADIVPPKDRGKYMGPMGAVFGLCAVLGPILGVGSPKASDGAGPSGSTSRSGCLPSRPSQSSSNCQSATLAARSLILRASYLWPSP